MPGGPVPGGPLFWVGAFWRSILGIDFGAGGPFWGSIFRGLVFGPPLASGGFGFGPPLASGAFHFCFGTCGVAGKTGFF